jgi:hypothetical protein
MTSKCARWHWRTPLARGPQAAIRAITEAVLAGTNRPRHAGLEFERRSFALWFDQADKTAQTSARRGDSPFTLACQVLLYEAVGREARRRAGPLRRQLAVGPAIPAWRPAVLAVHIGSR